MLINIITVDLSYLKLVLVRVANFPQEIKEIDLNNSQLKKWDN